MGVTSGLLLFGAASSSYDIDCLAFYSLVRMTFGCACTVALVCCMKVKQVACCMFCVHFGVNVTSLVLGFLAWSGYFAGCSLRPTPEFYALMSSNVAFFVCLALVVVIAFCDGEPSNRPERPADIESPILRSTPSPPPAPRAEANPVQSWVSTFSDLDLLKQIRSQAGVPAPEPVVQADEGVNDRDLLRQLRTNNDAVGVQLDTVSTEDSSHTSDLNLLKSLRKTANQ
eukprot:TRINITY_DN22363_c0_g1_i1.p1 TRINITY_DN22363_c0_g1~~TRINITY_DN22363_c0_g1_i1.p1  ORF type:complete len:251 (-),score=10.47 TRINITY_DN22363_c0_g1_i1:20-703(-)